MPKADKSKASSSHNTAVQTQSEDADLVRFVYGRKRITVPRPPTYSEALGVLYGRFHGLTDRGPIVQIWTAEVDFLDSDDELEALVTPNSWKYLTHASRFTVNSRPYLPSAPVLKASPINNKQIFLRTLTGKTITTYFSPDTTLEDLQRHICASEGPPCCQQRLIHGGKQLAHGVDLSYLRERSTITLVLRLTGGKPVIYLFPPAGATIDAQVQLDLVPQWSFSALYPVASVEELDMGGQRTSWSVEAHSKGTILDKKTGSEVAYLFWEAETNCGVPPAPQPTELTTELFDPNSCNLTPSNSVLLSVADIPTYLDKTLLALGLHVEARTSFITYWLPSLLKHQYIALRFVPQSSYERAAPLTITPTPDVINRVFMLFKGVQHAALSSWANAIPAEKGAEFWKNVVGVRVLTTEEKEKMFEVLEWGGDQGHHVNMWLLATLMVASSLTAADMRPALPFRLDMRHTNPAESPAISKFQDPAVLKEYGYTGDVINVWTPPQSAITFDSFDARIFPPGSDSRAWVEKTALGIRQNITSLHDHGLQALFWTDLIVVPRTLFDSYKVDLTGSLQNDTILLERPFTQKILRYMIREIFQAFPDMDGLVIRTGEIYTQDMPYHRGNNPLASRDSHVTLLNLLRDEVCVRAGKLLIYRTWSTSAAQLNIPGYYLAVTDAIEPHEKLLMAVKHTQLDYWRTVPFNPTIGIGQHQQIIEVQCQREYEGKGAYPNYIGQGVIDGFEEDENLDTIKSLSGIMSSQLIVGIWTWSRGGGWAGPHIPNELWIDLNTYVLSQYALDPSAPESVLFGRFATARLNITQSSVAAFRELVLKATSGVLYGHYVTVPDVRPLTVLNWSRDMWLGGNDHALAGDFDRIVQGGEDVVRAVLEEKARAVRLWKEVVALANGIQFEGGGNGGKVGEYLRASSAYGSALFESIAHAWTVMLLGHRGGVSDIPRMRDALQAYDAAWTRYTSLPKSNDVAELYIPYEASYGRGENGTLYTDWDHGMRSSLEWYRTVVQRAEEESVNSYSDL